MIDVAIYIKSFDGHLVHFRLVFNVLRKEQLYMNLKSTESVIFLEFVVSRKGIVVDVH